MVVRVAAMAPGGKTGTLAWSGVGSGVADGVGVGSVVGVGVGADEADGSAGAAETEGPARQAASMPVVRNRPIAVCHRVDCRVIGGDRTTARSPAPARLGRAGTLPGMAA